MAGWGSLSAMNKTIERNRALLKRKSLFEKKEQNRFGKSTIRQEEYKEEAVRPEVLDQIRQKLKSQRRWKFIKGTLVLSLSAMLVAFIIFRILNNPKYFYDYNIKESHHPRVKYFKTITTPLGEGVSRKREFFNGGPRSAETFYQHGLKHGKSRSYYQTGELFRSAMYDSGLLITETYLYRKGDTIQRFPALHDRHVYAMEMYNKDKTKTIEFYLYDAKILTNSYKETNISK